MRSSLVLPAAIALATAMSTPPAHSGHFGAHLWVASDSPTGFMPGNITTLHLMGPGTPGGKYTLAEVSGGRVNTSSIAPSWLEYDLRNKILYLISEGSKPGGVISYKLSPSGTLTELSRANAPAVGGVSAVFYNRNQALAVAHYGGSVVAAYKVSAGGTIELIQTLNFSRPDFRVGPVAARQEAPHPHQVLLDPTGRYILVPDLGLDQVHVLTFDKTTMRLGQQAPLKTFPGYGPRHGAFSQKKIGGSYAFYLVGELASDVTAFKVDYSASSLQFKNISSYGTVGPKDKLPYNTDGSTRVAPAEISLTPDGQMLIVSNRNDTSFGKSPPIDSLATFKINQADGTLEKLPLVSARGSFPRHFSLNQAGTLLAVALQESGRISILRKDQTGLFSEEIAAVSLPVGADKPRCVVWHD